MEIQRVKPVKESKKTLGKYSAKKRQKSEEMDYEGIIHSILLEKYLALQTLNFIDIESDRFDKLNSKKVFKLPQKKIAKGYYTPKVDSKNMCSNFSSYLKANNVLNVPRENKLCLNKNKIKHNSEDFSKNPNLNLKIDITEVSSGKKK